MGERTCWHAVCAYGSAKAAREEQRKERAAIVLRVSMIACARRRAARRRRCLAGAAPECPQRRDRNSRAQRCRDLAIPDPARAAEAGAFGKGGAAKDRAKLSYAPARAQMSEMPGLNRNRDLRT
jgi:hypothetical protein